MFYLVAENSKFPTDKWRFDKIDPDCSVALPKSNVFLLIYCKLKTNFIAKSQLLYMGCRVTRGREQKKSPIFIFKSVRARLRESVRLRECVSTEFDREVKRGFEKASVSRAVRLRECPLAGVDCICFQKNMDTYTLFDGFTDNTRGYFTSCVVFFRAPQGQGKMRATSKMSASIICKTIE